MFQGIDALRQDFTGGGYDENEPHGDLDTPTEVLAIGRVTAKVADGQQHSSAADWDVYWDREQNVVHSNTGQLTWDYNADGTVLIEAGGLSLLLEPVQATLRLKGSELESVRVVDIYGVPTERAVERNGEAPVSAYDFEDDVLMRVSLGSPFRPPKDTQLF